MSCYENLICRRCLWYDDINDNGCYLSSNCLLYGIGNSGCLDYSIFVEKCHKQECDVF